MSGKLATVHHARHPSERPSSQNPTYVSERPALAAVPGAGDRISYGIPTITLAGHYVVYFGAWKHHISVYPVPDGDGDFEREIAPFRAAKGTLKFPLGNSMPYELIEKVATLLAERERQRGGY